MNRGVHDGHKPEAPWVDREFFFVPKTASIKDRILLSPVFKYVVPVISVVVILITATYLTLYFVLENSPAEWPVTCNIKSSYRVECFPGRANITYALCRDEECCWNDESQLCFHSVPARHGYTQINSGAYEENQVLVPRKTLSPAGTQNAEFLLLGLDNVDADHVAITFKIGKTIGRSDDVDPAKSPVHRGAKFLRVTPDDLGRKSVNIQHDNKSKMNVHVAMPEFSVTVTRKDAVHSSLLSTARGPLILTETYWEFTLYVTNSSLYGLNRLELNGTTTWIYDNENGYARPSFLGIDDAGRATACYVNHDGPMEIKVLNGSNLVVLRGVSLPSEISLHVFAGPTPIEAVSQLTKALRPDGRSESIPASSLGLHVCPDDDATDVIGSLSGVIETMAGMEAPWDSHCLHQGFDPTIGNPLSEIQIETVANATGLLESEGRSLVPHLSAMLVTAGNPLVGKLANSSLLLRDSSGDYRGRYRNEKVVYPDWFDNRTRDESLGNFAEYFGNFESPELVYLRDSWPRDERKDQPVPNDGSFDYMPAALKGLMANGTVPYNLRSSSSSAYHYSRHNKYAREFGEFVGSVNRTTLTIRGRQTEEVDSSWAALRAAISAGTGSCLVGELPPPMYVCGTGDNADTGNVQDELCIRWYGSAVMWPHIIALPENLPGGERLTASSSRYAAKHLQFRASLVTYARTTLARYYTEGAPILAPTSVHYPEDLRARRRWNQYFWGDAILVGLVTLPRVTQVLMWLPGEDSWRHLQGGSDVYHPSDTNDTSVPAVRGQIVTLIRPGFVVPIHEEINMTAEATVSSDLTLVVNWPDRSASTASGKIFYGTNSEDGAFLDLTVSETNNYVQLNNVLKVKERACGPTSSARQSTVIKKIEIVGEHEYNVNVNLCDFAEDSPTIKLIT